jgi:hypothetical protein
MTVSLPYLWPRLTTCLTIRNVKTKADIVVEPRRLDSTGTLNDFRERNGHYGVSSAGRAARRRAGVTIFGIQNDRIVRVGSTWSTSALQAAMKRAIERHNMTRFTPVGHARDLAVTTLRLVIEALADGNTALAAAVLEQVQPDSPDNTTATVAGCIGVALGLLDDWLTGSDPHAPSSLGQRVKLPAGHWLGERAATDILVLARKDGGRSF